MKSSRECLGCLSWILILLLFCFSAPILAQDGNEEENGQYLEGELLERARNFAIQEYNRAVKFGVEAQEIQPPSNRRSYYNRMHEALEDALRLFEAIKDKPDEYQQIPALLRNLWVEEFNTGMQILRDESVRQNTENPEERAKAHLENAIIIQPDSAMPYFALASLLLQKEDTTGALSTYEQGIARLDQPEAEVYEDLLDLYFSQSRYEEVISRAREAREIYPEEISFIQFLADAHLQLGDSESALTLIRELTDKEPDNPRYYFILGSLSHQLALQYHQEAREARQSMERLQEKIQQPDGPEHMEVQIRIDSLQTLAGNKEKQGERFMQTAIEELTKAGVLDPDNVDVFNTLGMIYQNRAVELFEKRDEARGQTRAMELDERARIILTKAMENYEKASDLHPEKSEYWDILYRIYSELGMIHKAEEALEKLEDG